MCEKELTVGREAKADHRARLFMILPRKRVSANNYIRGKSGKCPGRRAGCTDKEGRDVCGGAGVGFGWFMDGGHAVEEVRGNVTGSVVLCLGHWVVRGNCRG